MQNHWYRFTLLHIILLPLSWAFGALVAIRKWGYQSGVFSSVTLPVPVIVVGNITVGGSGKTPLVLWLADFLSAQGKHPGIISRGYGGDARQATAVTLGSDAAQVGDEPLLLAQRSHCPVWVGRDRAAVGEALLAACPECDVLICDDGLQHYRLQRAVEIAVIDGERGLGNGLLLPAGPLREKPRRLDSVDAVVVNARRSGFIQTSERCRDKSRPTDQSIPDGYFEMQLLGEIFYNLKNPALRFTAEKFVAEFSDKRCHAIAGIGDPQRFFSYLESLGLNITPHAFADHHPFAAEDLRFGENDVVLMTEKDAVKCSLFAQENFWVLPVSAQMDADFGKLISDKLVAGSL